VTWLDDRGRLFGRVNVIDALVVVVILVLIPLVYGAFLLFRVPQPTIAAVEPNTIVEQRPATLKIRGDNFRAYLTAVVGAAPSPFLLQAPDRAEIHVPALLPGKYDLVLSDEAQELTRIPGAITVTPLPTRDATIRVRFIAPPEILEHIAVGDRDISERPAQPAAPTADASARAAPEDAVLTSLGTDRQPVTAVVQDNVLGRLVQTPQPMFAVTGSLRLPLTTTATGWRYKDHPVKVGARFLFETEAGAMAGAVEAVQFDANADATK